MIYSCNVFGISRQAYYKQIQAVKEKQNTAEYAIDRVLAIRKLMPRIGTRKLYHLLGRELSVGRDKLFRILKANNLLISAKRSYHQTTNSKHWLKKHKNIINNTRSAFG